METLSGRYICVNKQLEKGDVWRKMWFVVNDHVLYTYKAPADAIAGDSQPLLGYDFDLDVAVSLTTFKLKYTCESWINISRG